MHRIYFLILMIWSQSGYCQTQQYDKVINYYQSEKNFNGVALVATDGKIDFIGAKGVLNRQTGTVITTKSKFKIASITKTFTAVLILQLVDEGKIDLKATFGTYFPTYKGEAKDKVTIENLLTYSSGLPNKSEILNMAPYQTPITLDGFIDKYCSETLIDTPGKKSVYGNLEYIILHKIVENLTNKSFENVLYEKILKPLKMENTNMLKSSDIIPGLSSSYMFDTKTQSLSSDEPYFIETFFGSGAIYSTAEDLLKFDDGIFNNKLLSKKTTDLMIAPHRNLENVAFGFWFADGYGIFNKKFVYRPGGILGANSNWIHTLEDKKSIIVFSNLNATNLYEMSEQLYLVSKGLKTTYNELKKSTLKK